MDICKQETHKIYPNLNMDSSAYKCHLCVTDETSELTPEPYLKAIENTVAVIITFR